MRDLALQKKAEQFEALNLECKLMIFHRSDCECSDYWARNGKLLIPQILDHCEKEMIDPLTYFCEWAAAHHKKHVNDGVLYN